MPGYDVSLYYGVSGPKGIPPAIVESLSNALQISLRDPKMLRRIAEFGEGRAPDGSEDAGGDLVMPGLIELHTDHLEAHYVPRPKVFWDATAAVVSYDAQLATCGITTVLDSLRVWREDGAEDVDGRAGVAGAAARAGRAGGSAASGCRRRGSRAAGRR